MCEAKVSSSTQTECYVRSLQLNPDYANAWNNLGVGCTAVGQPRCFRWRHRAGQTLHQGLCTCVEECFVRSLELNLDDAQPWVNLGASGGGTVQGKRYTMVECFDKCLAINPQHPAGKAGRDAMCSLR
eukprot:TRINITY_DN14578_c0_g1_i6.p2 TRINITY_DN14578_c0_g1~~TRINITY_DN14578_c0_g1_i6.p2  ORF type:complete len:128 (+),score=19.68 TRINITY_DN14578_c0_g1_i6:254-637(+)